MNKQATLIVYNLHSLNNIADYNYALCNYDALIIFIDNNNFINHTGELKKLLNSKERSRLERFIFLQDQINFIIQHGILNLFLLAILETDLDKIKLNKNSMGKPFLVLNEQQIKLNFNISHSKHYTIFAFSKDYEVGVDIEENSQEPNLELAPLVFAPEELELFRALPRGLQQRNFLRLWTHKEALTKALGHGLNMNFSDIQLGLDFHDYQRFVEYNDMLLCDISRLPHFFASLALSPLKP
jgi:4'-phosphopantetheinyl transferase